jgi:hypothetical protein
MGGLAQEYGGGSPTSGRQYLVPDHLGSTRLMLSNGGTVQLRTNYYPFGQQIGDVRVRYYPNNKGTDGIERCGTIRAGDQGEVFAESTKNKPKLQVQVEQAHQLKPGHGRNYVETYVAASRVSANQNARTGQTELKIKGDVKRDNEEIVRR